MAAKIAPPATLARVQELHDAGNSLRKIAEILEAEASRLRAAREVASCECQMVLGGD